MLRSLPRALVARYAPPVFKKLLRRTWRRVQGLRARGPAPRLVFAFAGRTEYAPGTGRELYAHEPVFRATIQECERISTQVLGGPSIIGNFTGLPEPDFFADEARLMVTSAVMQLALVDLWLAQGVQPSAILGISLGEAAAVYAAGGLSLTDAMRVCLCYCAVSQATTRNYALLVVQGDAATVGRLAAECPTELFVVLVLNAGSCLAFCPQPAVEVARQYLAAHAMASTAPPTRPIWPYHSPHLAWHLDALRGPLHGLQPQPLALPCYLARAGGRVPVGTVLGIEYWLALIQYPVNAHAALEATLADGYSLFLPIGAAPFPFLTEPAQRAVLRAVQVLPALRPDEPERSTLAACRQQLTDYKVLTSNALARPALSPTDFVGQFSLRALASAADPYPAFAHLHRLGSLHFAPSEGGWLVLSVELVNAVLREPTVFSSTINSDFDTELIGADPPLHTLNRQLLQSFFAPKELAALRGFTEGMVTELAGAAQGRPSFDFVTELVIPLTQAVSARLLGLSTAERQQLQASLPGPTYALGYVAELNNYLVNYFGQKQPTEEPLLLNRLLLLIRDDQTTVAVAVSLAQTMWMASITTTSMLISNAVHYLLTHPVVADQLRVQPELIDAFIEEILRLEPPLGALWRTVIRPVTLGGQEIPAGASVVCSIVAANRDPARYTRPDELDLHRRPARHLSFGGGVHACLGAHLARLEARVVVEWLLAHGPALRLTNASAPPEYFPTQHFRALATLPLTLQPTT
ncbi:cytochrome P450 [Hymenobacter convexus]|uniref:cytochrome P450 n=1 Tax=Hymenobacter sp. CA1UV-4 TaxID=3063782 RepID=UPI002713A2E2|nr:cytochrome P450 [Hymenobacter sp. CA1UV-4]MDO7852001.1 cytochrome P450 [Hymenobacter sp. CA1UV-4]